MHFMFMQSLIVVFSRNSKCPCCICCQWPQISEWDTPGLESLSKDCNKTCQKEISKPGECWLAMSGMSTRHSVATGLSFQEEQKITVCRYWTFFPSCSHYIYEVEIIYNYQIQCQHILKLSILEVNLNFNLTIYIIATWALGCWPTVKLWNTSPNMFQFGTIIVF